MISSVEQSEGLTRLNRMTFVDALRGIAALCVVMNHTGRLLSYGDATRAPWIGWLRDHTHLFSHGVDVFFVISGFVIAHSIGSSRVSLSYAGRFLVRRSIRLDPPYWAAIVLAVAILLIRSKVGHEQPELPSAKQIFSHLLYVQKILGFEHINDVFWTLCLEVQFYMIFIVALVATDRLLPSIKAARAWLIVFAFVCSLAWPAALLPTPNDIWESVWFAPQWHKFLIGALVYYAGAGLLPKAFLWIPIAALSISIGVGHFGRVAINHRVYQGLWVGVATASAFSIAVLTGGIWRWLSAEPLQWAGRISYSLYLVHVPVVGILLGVQTRLATRSPASVIAFIFAVYLLSLVGSIVMYGLIERPSIRLAKRLRGRERLSGEVGGPALPSNHPAPITAVSVL